RHGGPWHCGTNHLSAHAPVARSRASVLIFGGARSVGTATGGFEKFYPFRSTSNRLAGRGREFGGSAQEPGASKEPGGDQENGNSRGSDSQFECQDFVSGQRARRV